MSNPKEQHQQQDGGQDPAEVVDRQTEARLQEIETIVKQQPLTSAVCPVADLEQQYAASKGKFLEGIKALGKQYDRMRMIRGDGNCYYRAFLYSLAEAVLVNPDIGVTVRDIIQETWKAALAAGYDELMLEAFFDTLTDLFERIHKNELDETSLHIELNTENSTSDYCTWYFRVVTATHLKSDPDRFVHFIEGGLDVEAFCKANVEPMGKECEQVQVLALAEALKIEVSILYLDGHELTNNNELTKHTFGPSTSNIKLSFLYRPGHYDVIYPIGGSL